MSLEKIEERNKEKSGIVKSVKALRDSEYSWARFALHNLMGNSL